ncbi:MAG: nuclease [Selenomonadaceae bacterium]|nr:nuclease [Selenomonadaceae bacterium]
MKKFFAAVGTIIFMTATFATVLAANYVGNANSKKFHVGNCSFVGKMNPKNRVDFQTRDEAIQAGYVPCKRCNP